VANLHVLECVDGAWGSQATENQTSSWGAVGGDSWNKAASNIGSTSGASVGWGKATLPNEDLAGSSRGTGDNWSRGNLRAENSLIDSAVAWDKGKTVIGNQTSSWGDAATGKNQVDSWGKCNDAIGAGSWEKKKRSGTGEDCWSNKSTGWNQQKSQDGRDTWGEAAENQEKGTAQNDSWGEAGEKWESKNSSEKPTEAWGKAGGGSTQTETEDVNKGSGWMKAEVDSAAQTANWSHGKKFSEDASGWNKDGSGNQNQIDSWNKPKPSGADRGSWNKQGESSWGKQEGGSSWNIPDRDQEFGGWNKESDGGRGSGGRRGRGEEEVVMVVEITLAEEDPLVMVSLQVGNLEKTTPLPMIKEVAGVNPRGSRKVEMMGGSLFLLGVIVDQVGTRTGEQIKRLVEVGPNGTVEILLLGTNQVATVIKLNFTAGAKVLLLIYLQEDKLMVLVGMHPSQLTGTHLLDGTMVLLQMKTWCKFGWRQPLENRESFIR